MVKNIIMKLKDVISVFLVECYVIIEGKRYFFM